MHKKSGRPPELIVEDQVLMVLQYWREYRTYFHIGQDFGIAESTVCRIVHNIENILIKSRKFSLPRRLEIADCRLQILFGTSPARKWAE